MRPPKFHPNWSTGRRVIAFQTLSNIAAIRHRELKFCHTGPRTMSTMLFGCPVKIWCRSDICRRRYCDFDFASLAEKCLTTLVLLGFIWGGVEPFKIAGVINVSKRNILG